MTPRDRIGFDADHNRIEDAIQRAAASGFHYMDFKADKLKARHFFSGLLQDYSVGATGQSPLHFAYH